MPDTKNAGTQADRATPSDTALSAAPAFLVGMQRSGKKIGRPRLNRAAEEKKALRREYLRKYRREEKLKEYLKNVLIAFAHPKPLPEHYEWVNDASLFLQSIDEDWKRVCTRGISESA